MIRHSANGRLGVATAFFSVLVGAQVAAQGTLYVDDDNCPGPGIGTVADPFCRIQDAINTSIDGDEIVVAAGTYNELINFDGKRVRLRSSEGAQVTTIDGSGLNGSVVRCESGEGRDSVLDGFRIAHGTGSPSEFGLLGGGMMNIGSSPHVTNCIFENNFAPQSGGGIANLGGAYPLIDRCRFIANSTSASGGAIVNDASSPEIVSCVFMNNTAGDFGGAIYNQNADDTIQIGNSLFVHNRAGAGGALAAASSSLRIRNCTFTLNQAIGGGCCGADGEGGGIFDRSGSAWSVTNAILWQNFFAGSGSGGNAEIYLNNGSASVNYTCIEGGWSGSGGAGIVANDPMFVDEDGQDNIDNFRLSANSPAIDAGDNSATDSCQLDLVGNLRRHDDPTTPDTGNGESPVVDMGAFEFGSSPPMDCNENGIPDNCEIGERWKESFEDGFGPFSKTLGNGETLFLYDEQNQGIDGTFVRYLSSNNSDDRRYALFPFGPIDASNRIVRFSAIVTPLSQAGGSVNSANAAHIGLLNNADQNPVAAIRVRGTGQEFRVQAGGHGGEPQAIPFQWGTTYFIQATLNGPARTFAIEVYEGSPAKGQFLGSILVDDAPLVFDAIGLSNPKFGSQQTSVRVLIQELALNGMETVGTVDCNSNGTIDFCELDGNDCNQNGTIDGCEISEGSAIDCNGNGIPDECDIIFGTTADCNANAVPDECDLALGSSADCNANAVPDECDLTLESSTDCNANGVPDECDVAGLLYWTDPFGGPDSVMRRANLDGTNGRILVEGLSHPRGMAVDSIGGEIYWTEPGSLTIRKSKLDGSSVQIVQTVGDATAGVAIDAQSEKMYWTESGFPLGNGQIRRADLDGFNVELLVPGGLYHPVAISLDIVRGKMYWSDLEGHLNGTGRIQRANLDGSDVETIVNGVDEANGLVVDPVSQKIFWTELVTQKIQRSDLDGTNVEDVLVGLDTPTRLVLDLNEQKLYWTDSGFVPGQINRIQRANLDGSEAEMIVSGIGFPWGIAIQRSQDCNTNGLPDECELVGNDCNANGVLDACDIAEGIAQDCQPNGVPDACDIASDTSRDCNADSIPDECAPIITPSAEPDAFSKCRTVSIVPGNAGRRIGLRVALVSLHHVMPPYTGAPSVPYASFEGQVRWVGPPRPYVESTSNQTQFYASPLQCEPYYRDWESIDVVHVYGSEVVPSSTYDIQAVSEGCSHLDEANYTSALRVQTTRWGDVEIPFNPPSTTAQPDVGDIASLVNQFRSSPSAPGKARAVLVGSVPDFGIDIGFDHIAACVDAFRGRSYPYTIAGCP